MKPAPNQTQVDGQERLVTYKEWSDLIQASFEKCYYVPLRKFTPVVIAVVSFDLPCRTIRGCEVQRQYRPRQPPRHLQGCLWKWRWKGMVGLPVPAQLSDSYDSCS